MRRIALFLSLFFAALPALAQVTAVTGTVTDSNAVPYAGGTIKAQLVLAGPGATGQATVTVNNAQQCRSAGQGSAPCQVPFQGTVGPVALDNTGSFSLSLQDNALVNFVGSQWLLSVTNPGAPPPLGTGPQSCSATLTITGASQSVTSSFSACPALSKASGNPNSTLAVAAQLNAASSGIVGMYLIPASDSVAALTDFSTGGVGNAVGTVDTAPTITAVTGGLACPFGGAVKLPAALNSNGAKAALAMMVVATEQTDNSVPLTLALVGGNGNGATGNNIDLAISNANAGITNFPGAMEVRALAANTIKSISASGVNGTFSLALTLGASDLFYINGQKITDCNASIVPGLGVCGVSAGFQTVGNYQLCGTAAGSGQTVSTYIAGTIYAAIFWNRVPSDKEIFAVHTILAGYTNSKGVPINLASPRTDAFAQGDLGFFQGDSITGGTGTAIPWPNLVGFSSTFNALSVSDDGLPNITASNLRGSVPFNTCPFLRPLAGKNFIHFWAGTNDIFAGQTASQAWRDIQNNAFQERQCAPPATKIIVATMLSRSANDTGKNSLNALIRSGWRCCFDALNDIAADALVGADGASAGAGFQGDGVHPTQVAYANNIAEAGQRTINELFGNQDFSSGNTYTVSPPAATAITAASESGNIMTFTMAANPWNGQADTPCVKVTGVTPAGYNSPTTAAQLQCWHIISNTATTFTAYNPTSGLGVGTVFGTALAPQERDADVFATLGGSAAGPSHTLQSCLGRTGQPIFRRITNTNATPWVISPQNAGETINGGATLTAPVASATNWPVVRLEPILTSAAAGGCTWLASLQ